MATGKRYYWMKLKESFMTSDTIDYFMEQPDGANYVVLYQLLCLKTINTGGRLSRQIGEIIIPYDVSKIQRDCKWFSADTVRVALKLYQAAGLIYEDVDGTLVLADHENLVGSETDWAVKKSRQRSIPAANSSTTEALPSGDNVPTNVPQNVPTDIEIDIRDRDKRLDIRDRDKKKEKEKKKADAFSEFAGANSELLSALRDFEQMRNKIKKPLMPRAKTMLVNKLEKEFQPEDWIAVLEQSITNCWQSVYPLKNQEQQKKEHSVMDDLRQLHDMFGDE